ncbi:MAG: ATP-binding cassette domain-containing protein, partial [Clostridia bacterium]|nr:ATP-binding cassette domain-containing protein [Clostridia bacterium]
MNNCTFRYNNTETDALRELSLTVLPGECVVLCGKSGCGKTTLTRLLNGLIPSFFGGELSGRCEAFGLRAGESPIEDYVPLVGSVFQNPKTQYFNVDTTA